MSRKTEFLLKTMYLTCFSLILFAVAYQSYLNREKEEQNYKHKKISLRLESLVELTDSTIYKN